MFRLVILLTVVMLTGCANTGSQHSTTKVNHNNELVYWIDNQLIPYMTQTLSTHPKFTGSPILIVGLESGQINNEIDTLTKDIREHLMTQLIGQPGIHMVRRQIDYQKNHHRSMTDVSCDVDVDAKYIIGLELKQSSITDGYNLHVKAAATDNPDQWVTGFSQTWRGNLTAKQLKASSNVQPDNYLKGLRDLPFNNDEKDLLAQYMAHNLTCVLAQSGHSNLNIFIDANQLTPEYRDILKMTGNMLNRFNDIQLTFDHNKADAVLEFDIIKLNQQTNLKQLNVEVVFADGRRASGTASQVYINFAPTLAKADIKQWQFVVPKDLKLCQQDNPWQSGEYYTQDLKLPTHSCFALKYHTTGNHNYVVYHSPDGHYAKLTNQCLTMSNQHNKMRLPAKVGYQNAIYLTKYKGAEQFYLISTANPLQQSTLKTWLDSLPDFCEDNRSLATNNGSLNYMLAKAAKQQPDLDWRVITLNHI